MPCASRARRRPLVRRGQSHPVWMTEHNARVPENAWTKPDWKALWPETANLQAAISVADMLIATAQMPEVKGGMVHALHASDGPWPMFHRSRDGNHIYPSAVFYALQMLRTSMLPEVLHTVQERRRGKPLQLRRWLRHACNRHDRDAAPSALQRHG